VQCGMCRRECSNQALGRPKTLPDSYPFLVEAADGYFCLGCLRTNPNAWRYLSASEERTLHFTYGIKPPEEKKDETRR